jgi:hypothetical protein
MIDEPGQQQDFTRDQPKDGEDPVKGTWDRYHQELLRWNRQINLVSRFQGEANLSILTRDCWDTAEVLPKVLSLYSADWAAEFWGRDEATSDPLIASAGASPSETNGKQSSGLAGESPVTRLVYVDIGSGAGFPGIVWHVWLHRRLERQIKAKHISSKTTLVEPRQKRAWFLHRVKRLLDLKDLRIWEKRWEDCNREGQSSHRSWEKTLWLFSLRALKMSDETVIASWQEASGLSSLGASDRLLICRFRPAGSTIELSLQEELCLPDLQITPGQDSALTDSAWALVNCGQNVSLLTSFYKKL